MHWTLCFPTNNVYFRLFSFLLFLLVVVTVPTQIMQLAKCSFNASQIRKIALDTELQHSFSLILIIHHVLQSTIGAQCPLPRMCWLHQTNVSSGFQTCYQVNQIETMGLPGSTFHEVRIFQGAKSIRCLLLYPLPGLWMHHKLQEQVGSEWTCRKWCRNQHMRPNKLEAESKDRISKRSLLPCQSIFSWWYFSEVSFLGLIVISRSRRRRADADLQ